MGRAGRSPPRSSSRTTPTARSPRSCRRRASSSSTARSGPSIAPGPRRSRPSTRSRASRTRPRSTRTRHLVLVTGVPGSGKTLVGLSAVHNPALDDLAVERAGGKPTAPAIFLSGNGPLVQVLQYELRGAGGGGKTFVRDVKNYVKQYLGDKAQCRRSTSSSTTRRSAPGTSSRWRPSTASPSRRASRRPSSTSASASPSGACSSGSSARGRRSTWARRPASVSGATALEKAGSTRGAGRCTRRSRCWTSSSARLGRRQTACRAHAGKRDARAHRRAPLPLRRRPGRVGRGLLIEGDDPRAGASWPRASRDAGYHLRMTRDLETAKELPPRALRRGSRRPLRPRRLLPRQDPRARLGHPQRLARRRSAFSSAPGTARATATSAPAATSRSASPSSAPRAWSSTACCSPGAQTSFASSTATAAKLGPTTTPSSTTRAAHVKDPFQLRVNAYRVLLTRGRDGAVIFVPPDPRLDATAAWLQAHGVKVLG